MKHTYSVSIKCWIFMLISIVFNSFNFFFLQNNYFDLIAKLPIWLGKDWSGLYLHFFYRNDMQLTLELGWSKSFFIFFLLLRFLSRKEPYGKTNFYLDFLRLIDVHELLYYGTFLFDHQIGLCILFLFYYFLKV